MLSVVKLKPNELETNPRMNQKIIYSSALLVGLGSPQAFAHKEKAHTLKTEYHLYYV